MDWLIAFPWSQTLLGVALVLGLVTAGSLLIVKYPASRRLGLFILSYVLVLLLLDLGNNDSLQFAGAVLCATMFFLYTRSFFDQKSRFNAIVLLPALVLGVLAFVLPEELHWTSVLLARVIVIGFGYLTIRSVLGEGKSRGISWRNAGSRIAWFRNFLLVNLVLLLILAINPIWLSTVFLASAILVVLAFLQFQVVKESAFPSPLPIANKYQKSTLTPAIKSQILKKIDKAMEEEEYYLRDDASLANLANELGTTTHHLSQVMNESMEISFQDLIAQYRIRKACQILRDSSQQQLKIENVANVVGYNSKSAFNTAFKKRIGLTPSEYREAKSVLSYREERLPVRKHTSNSRMSLGLSNLFSLKLKNEMGTNFFKIFFRNLKRNQVFSAINLFGLTVGFVCSILIYLFVKDESSFDKDIPQYEQIYRISWEGENPQTRTPHPMALAMATDWPEVETAVSLSPWYGPGLNREKVRVKNVESNIQFEEPDFFFADSTFFDVFDLAFVEGDSMALSKPWTLVITKSMATRYFGGENAIGKELEINDMPVAVSAVVEGFPKNSHFHFNALIPYMTLKQINPDDNWMTWDDFGHFNYIKIKEGVSHEQLESRIPEWVSNYLDWGQADTERLMAGELYFNLQPISEIHLTSNLRWELESNGNILYVYILGITLIFLLLIAGINYVNLTTAKSLERAKEIGVRKTLGAVSKNLSVQFYLESVFFCLVAMFVAFAIALLLLDGFNFLSGKNFQISDILDLKFVLLGLGTSVLIGFMAGVYPALSLSSFKPTEVLKGKLTTSSRGVRMRSLLVVVQFAVSTVLIAGSLIVLRQLDYMKNKELGFDQDAIISVAIPSTVELGGIDLNQTYTLRSELETIPGVKTTSMLSNLPGAQFNQHPIYALENPENRVDASEVMVDFGVEEVFGFEIVEGRGYDPSYAQDTTGLNFILNEAAVRELNLEEPVGKKVVWVENDESHEGTVIGIFKDFHYKSLHQAIQPLLLSLQPYDAGHLVIKMDGNNFSATLEQIRTTYASIDEELSFEYEFLDQQLADLYDNEVKTLTIFSVFAGIALILACLGLIGMAIAMLNQRIKEVGMRKILGASSRQIMGMIMMQFVRLIAVSLLIGLPVAYILMQNWIGEFSYQVSFGIWPYLGSCLILLIVAIISVSSAVAKISFSNPAETLRYE